MKKKLYVKPQTEVVATSTMELLAGTQFEGHGQGNPNGSESGGDNNDFAKPFSGLVDDDDEEGEGNDYFSEVW